MPWVRDKKQAEDPVETGVRQQAGRFVYFTDPAENATLTV